MVKRLKVRIYNLYWNACNKNQNKKLSSISLFISIGLFIYSFLFIGSSVSFNDNEFKLLAVIIRIFFIIFGFICFYLNYYVILFQSRISKNIFFIFTTFFAATAFIYFIFIIGSVVHDYMG